MKIIKDNKLIFILGSICFIIVIAVLVMAISLIPKSGEDGKYGNRLEKIENYPIDSKKVDEMKKTLKEQDGIKDVNYNLNGRLINVIIKVNNDLDVNKAKEYASKTTEFFTSEILGYYDLQVLLDCEEDSADYPLIGYKNKNSDSLVWKQ